MDREGVKIAKEEVKTDARCCMPIFGYVPYILRHPFVMLPCGLPVIRWNATSYATSEFYPGRIETVTDGAKGYGACAVALMGLGAVVALVATFALATRGTSLNPKFIPEEGPALAYSTAAAGCLVVVTALALYSGLAVGAHGEIKEVGPERDRYIVTNLQGLELVKFLA